MKGLYVVFEGIDYCGKGTIIRMLMAFLAAHPELAWLISKIVLVVEPNDKNRMAQHIRVGLADRSKRPKDPLRHQEQFMIDRYVTMVCDIGPALDDGLIVFGDRSYLSTLAYGSLKVPMDTLCTRHDEIVGPVMRYPQVVIYTDVTPEEAIRRLEAAGNKPEHFETTEKLTKVRGAYHTLMSENTVKLISHKDPDTGETLFEPHRWARYTIDGMNDPAAVLDQVFSVLEPHLRAWIAQHHNHKES